MKHLALVGIGGCFGAILRYKIGGWILHGIPDWKFPLSTFVVNVVGCLAAGILAGLVEKHDFFNPEIRVFLFTGLLGGFTTFSAFGLETVTLLQRHEVVLAVTNAILSVAAGVFALWLGIKIIP